MNKKLTIAIDFDGTLCEYGFPGIGQQKEEHKQLMDILIKMKSQGHKLNSIFFVLVTPPFYGSGLWITLWITCG